MFNTFFPQAPDECIFSMAFLYRQFFSATGTLPPAAACIARHPLLRQAVKAALMPVVACARVFIK